MTAVAHDDVEAPELIARIAAPFAPAPEEEDEEEDEEDEEGDDDDAEEDRAEIESCRDIVTLAERFVEAWDNNAGVELEIVGPPDRVEHMRHLIQELRRAFFARAQAVAA